MDITKVLEEQGVLKLKNASAELHFDDEGILQEITFRQKRRRRQGENLTIHQTHNGSATAHYDNDGIIQHIIYETKWRKPRVA